MDGYRCVADVERTDEVFHFSSHNSEFIGQMAVLLDHFELHVRQEVQHFVLLLAVVVHTLLLVFNDKLLVFDGLFQDSDADAQLLNISEVEYHDGYDNGEDWPEVCDVHLVLSLCC